MVVMLKTEAILDGASVADSWLSTLYWEPGTVGGSNSDATDCLARFRAFWNAMNGIVCSGVTATFNPLVLAIDAADGELQAAFTGATPSPVTFVMTGDPLPSQTQGLITWNTSTVVNGRRVRGRTYVPLPSESHNASGAPQPAYTTGLQAGVAALMTAGSTASRPVIWHRPPPAGGLGIDAPVIGGSASPAWSVLRSRR